MTTRKDACGPNPTDADARLTASSFSMQRYDPSKRATTISIPIINNDTGAIDDDQSCVWGNSFSPHGGESELSKEDACNEFPELEYNPPAEDLNALLRPIDTAIFKFKDTRTFLGSLRALRHTGWLHKNKRLSSIFQNPAGKSVCRRIATPSRLPSIQARRLGVGPSLTVGSAIGSDNVSVVGWTYQPL